MKHLACDLCGKPAPADSHIPNAHRFFVSLKDNARRTSWGACSACMDALSTVIHAKCAALKSSPRNQTL